MNKEKQIVCDGCGFYHDEFFIRKHKSGKNYCSGCSLIVERKPSEVKPVSQEEFNRMLEAFLNTPPLKLKDLQAKLRKERARKLRTKKNKVAKLNSKKKNK